jgi:hypothetical protein
MIHSATSGISPMQRLRYPWHMKTDQRTYHHCQTANNIAYTSFARDERLDFVEHVIAVLNESRFGTSCYRDPLGALAGWPPIHGSTECCSLPGSCFHIDLLTWLGADIDTPDSNVDLSERLRVTSLYMFPNCGSRAKMTRRKISDRAGVSDQRIVGKESSFSVSPSNGAAAIMPTAQPRGSPV